jgi:acyl-CoA thioester hydrolase
MSDAFELSIAVEPADIDQLGHVNNVTYVRWVQDAAAAHWYTVAPAPERDQVMWIVLRHEIDYKQAAYLDDSIVARTWVGAASRLRFERHTELLRARDRAVLALARTLWCPIDPATRKPVVVSAEVRARFSVI